MNHNCNNMLSSDWLEALIYIKTNDLYVARIILFSAL